MTIRITAVRLAVSVAFLATLCMAVGFQRTEQVTRYGSVIGVKPEKLEYYKQLHTQPWPTVDRAVKAANIRNYSIYLTQFDDGKWYLFSYFEYTGKDLTADMRALAAESEVKRWWKETDPCQIGLENRRSGEWWKTLEEVYHLD